MISLSNYTYYIWLTSTVPRCSTVSGCYFFSLILANSWCGRDGHLVLKDTITEPGHLTYTIPGVSFLGYGFHFRHQHMLNTTFNTVLRLGRKLISAVYIFKINKK